MARVVLIGGGRMGHRFSQAIRKAGHDLVSLFDPGARPFAVESEPELARIHETDFDAVLSSDADVYVICTTADHHVPLATALIEAGKRRLIIEKPLSQSAEDAERLRRMARARGVRVVVNHGRRYCPNTASLKALDGGGDTGALRSVAIRMGGGALGCVGTHWIDLCNNLMGGVPDAVFAQLSALTPSNSRGTQFVDPGGVALLSYAGGRRAVLDMGDDVGIVVGADFIYERGVVSWQFEGGRWSFRHRQAEDAERPLSLYGLPLVDAPFETVAPDLIAYAISALDDVLGEGPVISGLDQACDTMEVFAAIRASDRRDEMVRLPLGDQDRAEIYPIP